nr:hypothetical protein [Tanacetum cinerariifolium]
MIVDDVEHSIQLRLYLENSSNAIAPVLTTEEPEYSLSMRDEHLSTILETELDEVIKSSVKNLDPILRESEVTSNNESECDVPVKDESSPIFTTFSNPLFDCNNDFTSSDDESLSNEDVPVIHHPSQEMSKEVLQAKENLMKSIKTFLKKFNRISFGEMPKELAEYINSPSWNRPTFCDNDEEHSIQYKEYLESSSNAIASVLPTEEPEYSLSMGYEHLSTTSKIESDGVIKSSVKNFVPIPSENEVTSDDENTLFDFSPKFDYLKELSGELMPTSIFNEERIKREHKEYISLMEKLLAINSFPHPL